MKFNAPLFILVILLSLSCSDADLEKSLVIGCPTEDIVQIKEDAQRLLAGKWEWIKTFYINRASGNYIETSYDAGKSIFYEFGIGKVTITENNVSREETYEILVDEAMASFAEQQLKINFINANGELRESSLLLLSTTGQCLTLVNSYDDAGGDLNFQKTN